MISIGRRIISRNHSEARTLAQKALGLMFRWKVKEPLVFFFDSERIIPLHMLFVFTRIDVLYLDAGGHVVEMIPNFRQFSFYTPRKKAKYIIEMQPGGIEKNQIHVGNRVIFTREY